MFRKMLRRSQYRSMKSTGLILTVLAQPASMPSTPHNPHRMPSSGFTLVELIGVLAILAILASFVTPSVIHQLRNARRDAETKQLENIAKGIELFVRQTRSFPANLAALSPDYVQMASNQLVNNANGFSRYFFLQPNLAGFTNATGLAPTQLANARYLLISGLLQNLNPSMNTDADFENWWNTDETGLHDVKIHRGHLGHLFHLVSLSADGAGGSYSIDGTPTHSGSGTLAPAIRYHIIGTPVGLDEANTYGTAEVQFIMTAEAGYQFDPDCPNGSKWRVISSGCYVP